MAPSFWGPRATLQCNDCQIRWLANWQTAYQPRRDIRCWNCGAVVDVEQARAEPGDLVVIDPDAYRQSNPQVNDVVAVQDSNGWRVKRIVAGPGDTVDVTHDFRLQVNGNELTTTAPWIMVHDDRHRGSSGSWWQRDQEQLRIPSIASEASSQPTSKTLVYHHRSVYHQSREDVIRDDCIFNLNENRELRPVHHLALELQIDCLRPSQLQVWFHTDQIRYQLTKLDAGKHSLRVSSVEASVLEPASAGNHSSPVQLNAFQPVVIRVDQGDAEISNLVLWRPIEYWIDPTDRDTITFPVALGESEYFLIGDNVPLSIDSRHTGKVTRQQIRGKVLRGTSFAAPSSSFKPDAYHFEGIPSMH